MSSKTHRRVAGWVTAGAVIAAAAAGMAASPAQAAAPAAKSGAAKIAAHAPRVSKAQVAASRAKAPRVAKSSVVKTPAVAAKLNAAKPLFSGSQGNFAAIAAVEGTNHHVFVNAGDGYADLGGYVINGPAIASDKTGNDSNIYVLGVGSNGNVFLRTQDTNWLPVYGSTGGQALSGCTSITAAYDQVDVGSGLLYFSCLLGNYQTYVGTIDPGVLSVGFPGAATYPTMVTTQLGPLAYAASINEAGTLSFVGYGSVPGQSGPYGSVYQWEIGTSVSSPFNYYRAYLSCNQPTNRISSDTDIANYPNLRGVIACRSNTGAINYIGKNNGRILGGKIVGSPGIALNPTPQTDVNHFPQRFVGETDVESQVFAEGTNHQLYAKSVFDSANPLGFYQENGFQQLGGKIMPGTGVQATTFVLSDFSNPAPH